MKNTEFVSVDFEMANDDLSSICQLGFVTYNKFGIKDQWETLVKPKGGFGFYQTRVHGITEKDVADAPSLEDIQDKIISWIKDKVICSYGMNDFHALDKSIDLPECRWMDVSKVVNRVWLSGAKNQKMKLHNICEMKNIPLSNHHNALADALAAGELVNLMMQEQQCDIEKLLKFSMKVVTKKLMQENLFL